MSHGSRRVLVACTLLLATLALQPAAGHEARPVALDIHQRDGGHYSFELRAPASVPLDNRPVIVWPETCEAVASSLLRCAEPLPGKVLRIRWPLYNPSVTTLVRYQPRDGDVIAAVLPPDTDQWQVPAEPTRYGVIRGYFALGVGHILGGFDHLLFVAGLMLIARGTRSLLLAISGFTLGHSLTLTLAALGFVNVPVPPTEAAIALSLLFLAREALQPPGSSLVWRYPLLVSAAFGLLHGLGFAAALGEAGLPRGEIAWALLCFNLGVEAGQLAFIAVVLAGAAIAARLMNTSRLGGARLRELGRVLAAYVIGIPAAFWLLQRLPV